MAIRARIYLQDEPFGALDAKTKIATGRELLRMWSERGRSVAFVTLISEEAVNLSDRVLAMLPRLGRIVRDDAVDLPRPRDSKLLYREGRFVDYVDSIWLELDAGS